MITVIRRVILKLWNIFNGILLSRETKNLIKINKLHEEFNKCCNGEFLDELKLDEFKEKLLKINTVEHKSKINLVLDFIEVYKNKK